MKCDCCKREINPNESLFTAIGILLCEQCNTKNHNCVSLDMVLNKIIETEEKSKENKLKDMYIKDTTNDKQKFCGCRPEDCTDYNNIIKCRKCLDKILKDEEYEKRR
jgi:hypothetical protein